MLVQVVTGGLVLAPALAQRFARFRIGRNHFQHALALAQPGLVAQVDHQRTHRCLGAGHGDQHQGFFLVHVFAGDLVRDVGIVVEGPQQLVQLFGLGLVAGQHQGEQPGVVGLARQFADQAQRLGQEAGLGDQVEVGAGHGRVRVRQGPAARPRPASAGQGRVRHQARAAATGSAGRPGAGGHAALAFIAGHAGDVQVGPALAFGEARQEAAGGDRTGPAAADVVDVGEG